jgi:uncharacterized protein YcbK (DUF882 family)
VAHAQAPALPTPPPPTAPAAAPPAAAPAAKKTAPAKKAKPSRRRRRRHKAARTPPAPAAELYAVNPHETYHLRPDKHGRFSRAALRGWNRFLRCHHTGRVHRISARLAKLIYEVDQHFGFKRILVVAGYRAPRVARQKGNPKSPHKKGDACDFRIDGVSNEDLRDYERTLPHVGVGYYPNSDFVHLDVDPLRNRHSAFWIDYSGPGQRARYAKDPYLVLKKEKEQEEEDELAPIPTVNAAVGGEPQAPAAEGAPAPNVAPALQPTTQNH